MTIFHDLGQAHETCGGVKLVYGLDTMFLSSICLANTLSIFIFCFLFHSSVVNGVTKLNFQFNTLTMNENCHYL